MVNKKRLKYALLVLAIVWAAMMAGFSPTFVAGHRETKDVVCSFDSFASAVTNHQFARAYELCGVDFRTAMPYENFLGVQESLEQRYGPLTSVVRSSYLVRGAGNPVWWTANIDADLVYQKQTLRFEFKFHKEGGRWVLFGCRQLT